MISFGPTEEQELIRQTVHGVRAERDARSSPAPVRRERELPAEFLQKSWELGPGQGDPRGVRRRRHRPFTVTNALVLEELAWGDVPLAAARDDSGACSSSRCSTSAPTRRRQRVAAAVREIALPRGDAWRSSSRPSASTPRSLRTVARAHGHRLRALGQASAWCRWRRPRVTSWSSRAARRDGVAGLEAFIVPRDAPRVSRSRPRRRRQLGVPVPAAASVRA